MLKKLGILRYRIYAQDHERAEESSVSFLSPFYRALHFRNLLERSWDLECHSPTICPSLPCFRLSLQVVCDYSLLLGLKDAFVEEKLGGGLMAVFGSAVCTEAAFAEIDVAFEYAVEVMVQQHGAGDSGEEVV